VKDHAVSVDQKQNLELTERVNIVIAEYKKKNPGDCNFRKVEKLSAF